MSIQTRPKNSAKQLIRITYYYESNRRNSPYILGYFDIEKDGQKYLKKCKKWNVEKIMKELDLTLSQAKKVIFELRITNVIPKK